METNRSDPSRRLFTQFPSLILLLILACPRAVVAATGEAPLATATVTLGGILLLFAVFLPIYLLLRLKHRSEQLRDTVRQLEQRWKFALEGSGQGVWDWDLAAGRTYYSPEWRSIVGLEENDSAPALRVSLIHPDDAESAARQLALCLDGSVPAYESEHRIRAANGRYVWVLERGKVVERDAAARPRRLVGTLTDVSERRDASERIEFLATHDILTGLPNRALLADRLEHALTLAGRSGKRVAVILLDLDHFKSINEALGHNIGDLLLVAVAGRLMPHLRASDTISRQGGDEFVLLLQEVNHAGDVAYVCERLQQELAEPVSLDGRELRISASMGVALFPEDGEDGDTLLRNADVALYRVKDAGRRNFRFYSEDMNSALTDDLELASRLHEALARGEIHPHFQPQFDLATGELTGAEALARWTDAEGRSITPARFIPIAEEYDLIHPLGMHVLAEACRQALAWPRPLQVAVNLSAVQLRRPDIAEDIAQTLTATGLPPHRLTLEITESVLMQEAQDAQRILDGFAALGVKLSIDDFGTGYSSLAYLKRFPVHHLKIDRSFVKDLGADRDDEVIVRTIIQLGHSLNLTICAEGIETEAQRSLLASAGCDSAQGFLLGRPMDAAAFRALVGHSANEERNPGPVAI